MIEYKIVSGGNKDIVASEVNSMLSENWKLYGSLCIAPSGQYVNYAQALIREFEIRPN
jgi:hypothetical protein